VQLDPSRARYHSDLALALSDIGRLDDAIACARVAVAIDPAARDLRRNLGMLLLLKGQYQEGWEEYDHASEAWCANAALPKVDAALWQGEPLAGKSILVRAEQGLGDILQFARYVPVLADMKAMVTFAVPPKLVAILQEISKSAVVAPKAQCCGHFDFQCALLSLPRRLGSDPSNIPGRVPYLSADASCVTHWRHSIGVHGFKIGICWRGNPSYHGDRARSIALREFAPLAQNPQVRLISLQKRPGDAQISEVAFGRSIETLGENFDEDAGAFVDSAAVMMCLDLVVTSDTAIAHLAGALARPLCIALRRVPDWRWRMEREDCPYYPTARLFRQEREGDWADVFARIAALVRSATKTAGPTAAPV